MYDILQLCIKWSRKAPEVLKSLCEVPDALAWGFWTGSMCGGDHHSADEGNKILQTTERRGERETERGRCSE